MQSAIENLIGRTALPPGIPKLKIPPLCSHGMFCITRRLCSTVVNYDHAKDQFQKYNDLASTDTRASLKIAAIDNINDYYIDSALYTVKEVPTNSPEADFAPSYYMDGYIFASSRESVLHSYRKSSNGTKSHIWIYIIQRLPMDPLKTRLR